MNRVILEFCKETKNAIILCGTKEMTIPERHGWCTYKTEQGTHSIIFLLIQLLFYLKVNGF